MHCCNSGRELFFGTQRTWIVRPSFVTFQRRMRVAIKFCIIPIGSARVNCAIIPVERAVSSTRVTLSVRRSLSLALVGNITCIKYIYIADPWTGDKVIRDAFGKYREIKCKIRVRISTLWDNNYSIQNCDYKTNSSSSSFPQVISCLNINCQPFIWVDYSRVSPKLINNVGVGALNKWTRRVNEKNLCVAFAKPR